MRQCWYRCILSTVISCIGITAVIALCCCVHCHQQDLGPDKKSLKAASAQDATDLPAVLGTLLRCWCMYGMLPMLGN